MDSQVMDSQVMERDTMSGQPLEEGLGASGREARLAFGRAVRRRRERLRLTQQYVAEAIGLKVGVMSQLELGRVSSLPGPTMLRDLAKVLETTPEALLSETGYLADDAERTPELAFTATLAEVNRLPVDESLRGVIREAVLYAQKRWEDEQAG